MERWKSRCSENSWETERLEDIVRSYMYWKNFEEISEWRCLAKDFRRKDVEIPDQILGRNGQRDLDEIDDTSEGTSSSERLFALPIKHRSKVDLTATFLSCSDIAKLMR